jgi:hypothetical protein
MSYTYDLRPEASFEDRFNSNSTRSVAAHPFGKLRAGTCKKRKDGAPSAGMVHAKIAKGGPPAKI